jgi:uncharacterized protein YbjT (DUF2867 family)
VRVLVTGATGFTGGHLARTLASRGHQVRAFQRAVGVPPDPGVPGIDVTLGDLRDPAALARAVDNIDVVYHIAAIYRQAGVSRDVYRAVNATAAGQIVVSSTAARSECTATSSIPPPTKTRRSNLVISIRRRSSKGSAWRAKPARVWALK